MGAFPPPAGTLWMLRRDSTRRSFFDPTLYDRLIEPGHFLKHLGAAIDFGFVRHLCRGCYAPEVGRPLDATVASLAPLHFFSFSQKTVSTSRTGRRWCQREEEGAGTSPQ